MYWYKPKRNSELCIRTFHLINMAGEVLPNLMMTAISLRGMTMGTRSATHEACQPGALSHRFTQLYFMSGHLHGKNLLMIKRSNKYCYQFVQSMTKRLRPDSRLAAFYLFPLEQVEEDIRRLETTTEEVVRILQVIKVRFTVKDMAVRTPEFCLDTKGKPVYHGIQSMVMSIYNLMLRSNVCHRNRLNSPTDPGIQDAKLVNDVKQFGLVGAIEANFPDSMLIYVGPRNIEDLIIANNQLIAFHPEESVEGSVIKQLVLRHTFSFKTFPIICVNDVQTYACEYFEPAKRPAEIRIW